MDAVAAADAGGVLVFVRAGPERGQHPVQPRKQQVGCAAQLDVQRGVKDIRGGHALVDKARLILADDLGQVG